MENRFRWDVHPKAFPENILKGQNYRITVLESRLIRFEYADSGNFVDLASQSVFHRDFPKCDFTYEKSDGVLILKTDELIVTYKENIPFSTESLSVKLINEPASTWHFGDDYEDLGGTAKTLDEIVGNVCIERGICSRYGFTVLDDKDRMLLDDSGWVQNREQGTEDFYFFGFGYDYFGAIKAYYKLTGAPPLLPAYALGNWWSRYHNYTQKEYEELILRFKKEGVPFSVGVVDMDWHTTNVPPEEKPQYSVSPTPGWTGYTWNKELFPDHKAFLDFLHKENIKTSLNLHPADGIRKHESMYREMAEAVGIDFESGERVCLDVLNPDFMEKYFDIIHHPYEEEGVDFWWMDWQQGTNYGWIHEPNKDGNLKDPREALDPLWMLNHLHIMDISRDDKRPMFFSRFSGPGSHRYPVGFSGDTVVCWNALDLQPYFTATAWLPKGDWFDFFEGLHYVSTKGRKINIYRSLDKYPVLAKAGAIVPLQMRDPSDNRLGSSEEMQVVVFPGANNSFTLYEDSGDMNDYQNGAFAKTEMSLKYGDKAIFTIKPAEGDLSLIPAKRTWKIALRGFNRKIEATVSINGKTVSAVSERDDDVNTLYLTFTANVTDECTVTVEGESLMHDNCDWLERCKKILQFAQLRISTKNEMYELITAMWRPLHSRIWRTSAYDPEQHPVAEALHEMMTLNRGEFENNKNQKNSNSFRRLLEFFLSNMFFSYTLKSNYNKQNDYFKANNGSTNGQHYGLSARFFNIERHGKQEAQNKA